MRLQSGRIARSRIEQMRIDQVCEWFDLPPSSQTESDEPQLGPGSEAAAATSAEASTDLARLLPPAGAIALITGGSGAGKSTLLRALCRFNRGQPARRRWIDLSRLRLPNRPVVNCLLPMEMQQTLARLAQVGLAEAALLVRRPAWLSDGQRFRLRLAAALCAAERSRGRSIIACDEFAAALDDVTAAVVAQSVRRIVRASGQISVIVATSRDLLTGPLEPDVIARCDFGAAEITTSTNWRR